jgi:3-oxoadipate enol-lactonase
LKADINGITLNYTLEGPEDAVVVMMSHSLMCSGAMWDGQMAALADYRVLRVDTRGHGDSAAPAGAYTLEELAADFVGLLDHLRIDKVHYIGLSMGGMIGQVLGVYYGHRLKSLTLSSTMCEIPAAAGSMWQDRIALSEAEGMQAHVEGTIGRWFTDEFCSAKPDKVEPIRNLIRNTPLTGFAGCCLAISKLNMTEKLAGIEMPTLVIVGEDDPGTPVSAAEQIHSKIAGSDLVVIKDASHLLNVQQPEIFNKALVDFLAKNSI